MCPRIPLAVKFALTAGYMLGQVTQFSALDLPMRDGTLDAFEQKAPHRREPL